MTFFAALTLILNVSNPFLAVSHSTDFQPIAATQTVNFPNTETDPIFFEDSIRHLYHAIKLEEYGLSYEVFRYGMIGYYSLEQEQKLSAKKIISVIDFTKPSTEKRFYTIDLEKREVKFYTYVSHGKNTGDNSATSFSNVIHSNQSSLGFYITAETYVGTKGYSLKLDGQDKGYNDNMRARAVVMHEADYVSETWIKRYGRLGRSQGCPALPKEISKEVINTIKNRTLIFAYSDDLGYLNSSAHLKLEQLIQPTMANTSPASSTIRQ
jgi:L,D-transpeptidase catalytic domain